MRMSTLWPITALAFLVLLHFAKPVLVPLVLAFLLAQLLDPAVKRLAKALPRWLAVLVSLGLVVVVVSVLLAVLSDQLAAFQKNVPDLQGRLNDLLGTWQGFASQHLGLAPLRQVEIVRKGLESLIGAGGRLAMAALAVTMTAVSNGLLVAIFSFLMLYYRAHFRRGVQAIVARPPAEGDASSGQGAAVVERILEVSQRYVSGLLTVMLVIGVLDACGFLLAKVPFPMAFGLLGALAVLIPYVGIFIVAPACALVAWLAAGDVSTPLSVLGIFAVVHFLEGNVITPYFVGHQVNLNPLASLLAVLIGGELWGPAGMLLFIPLVGMAVIALESMPRWAPWAFLLGNVPEEAPRGKKAPRAAKK